MPRFINKNIATMNGVISGSDLYPALYSDKSVQFFSTLSEQLVTMTEALKLQFENLRLEALARCADGPIMADVTAPKLNLGIKFEYIQYINKYGPPPNGQFDPVILEQVRQELLVGGGPFPSHMHPET